MVITGLHSFMFSDSYSREVKHRSCICLETVHIMIYECFPFFFWDMRTVTDEMFSRDFYKNWNRNKSENWCELKYGAGLKLRPYVHCKEYHARNPGALLFLILDTLQISVVALTRCGVLSHWQDVVCCRTDKMWCGQQSTKHFTSMTVTIW